MRFEFIDSISLVEQDEWNALWPTAYPFTQYQFLHALEASGSTTAKSGWQPMHLIARVDDRLILAMPLYLKTHSYGEYVFDWAWADAYARYGQDYYPKLLNAIPFTPATGPRMALACDQQDRAACYEEILAVIQKQAVELKASSLHVLFPDIASAAPWQHAKLEERNGCQFHWFNDNYSSFDDFLSQFASRKRKNIRKEREKTRAYNVTIQPASEVSDADWRFFYQLYHRTYLKRSGRPGYLGAEFFLQLAQTMPEQLLLATARDENGQTIAGAVYFRDEECLYGRYWGAIADIDGLHFETCYYRGIEYAIEHKLKRFDPGAQGEHKIQRGFQPVLTRSYHWLSENTFRDAITHFCKEEREHNQHYIDDARTQLPFKEGTELVSTSILVEKN